MIRISVSDLESYRYFKNNEDGTLEDLVKRLLHQDPPTPNMLAGKAFAKFMETAAVGEFASATVEGWTFNFECEVSIALPAVRELKAEMVVETPSGPVTLVGVADGLNGMVRDQKLVEKFDPERYLDSLQWRAYLVMFNARTFIYDVFLAKYERARGKTVQVDGEDTFVEGAPTGKITVREYHPLRFFSYPNIRADVERAVAELAEVIVAYGIPKTMTAPPAPSAGATAP